jgi:hypothetical protein
MQPKLSNASIKPLLSIGPLSGLDATTDPLFVEGAYATDILNYVPNHAYQGITPIRGRIPGVIALLGGFAKSLSLWYPSNHLTVVATAANSLGSTFQYKTPPALTWTPILVPLRTSGMLPSSAPGQFSSYHNWLFFSNGDNQAQCYKFDTSMNATFWQIAPASVAPTKTITAATSSGIFGSGYYWRYTYSNSVQESSPSPPLGPINMGLELAPPNSNTATVTQYQAPTVTPTTGTGSIPSGTYYVGITFIIGGVESAISQLATATLSATGELTITAPASPPVGATAYNSYVGTTATNIALQGGSTAIGSNNVITTYSPAGPTPPGFTGNLLPPPAPALSFSTAGSLPARTEYYQLSYWNGSGQTVVGPEASIYLLAGQVAVVGSPPAAAGATAYSIYGSTTSGQEVLQNQGSPKITIGSNWTAPTAGIPLGDSNTLTLVQSIDPQVTTINVYRIGGSLGNWTLVGTVPNSSSPNFVDNFPDNQVVGQTLVLHRDPPAPFNCIFEHKERMCGFGYPAYTDFNGVLHPAAPSDFWYSNYAEPWGFDNTNQVIPVGAHDASDIGVTGGSLSSIALLMKQKTTWALYGESPSDFFTQKLFDVGIAGAMTFVIALGVAFWLSNQGVYMFDGATLTYISKAVKRILDGMNENDFAQATACFDDRMYWLTFPTQGISLGYDTVSQTWWKSNLTANVFAFDPEGPARSTAPDFVFGARTVGAQSFIDQWFGATTDLGNPISGMITSRDTNSGPEVGTFRVRYLELDASANISSNDVVTVTINPNPGASLPPAYTAAFTTSNLPRQLISAPAGLDGQELQLTITTTSSDALVLEGAAAHGWIKRLYNVSG